MPNWATFRFELRYGWQIPLFAFAFLTGCSPYIDPNVPEPIRPYVEPEHGGD